MAKWLIIAGTVLILAGVFWPLLSRSHLGHLPGDIYFERKGLIFYFPIATGIVLSLLLSFLFWIFRK